MIREVCIYIRSFSRALAKFFEYVGNFLAKQALQVDQDIEKVQVVLDETMVTISETLMTYHKRESIQKSLIYDDFFSCFDLECEISNLRYETRTRNLKVFSPVGEGQNEVQEILSSFVDSSKTILDIGSTFLNTSLITGFSCREVVGLVEEFGYAAEMRRIEQAPVPVPSAPDQTSESSQTSDSSQRPNPFQSSRLKQMVDKAAILATELGSEVTESNYLDVLGLYSEPCWPSFGNFTCPICSVEFGNLEGIIFKRCMIHKMCRTCVRNHIMDSLFKEILCPQYHICEGELLPDEIAYVLNDEEKRDYDRKRSRIEVENDPDLIQPYMLESPLAFNTVEVECLICFETCASHKAVVSRNCKRHYFCTACLVTTIRISETAVIKCPGENCDAVLDDREVRHLLTAEEYQRLHRKEVESLVAQAGDSAFHCRTPDCEGLWFVDSPGRFECPLCKALNCSTCKAIHKKEESCASFQADLKAEKVNNAAEIETEKYLKKLFKEGKAMACPKCGALVEKIDGCDGMECRMCKVALCWATKGLRWGPGGNGDWSGGCKCNMNGVRCTPQCMNCH